MNDRDNDLFFVCSLIEYIARKTKNTKEYVVQTLGKDRIRKLYEFASVYHCENIDKVTEEIIIDSNIKMGNYDILNNIDEKDIPSFWSIGRVYYRLIKRLSKDSNEYIDKLIEVMTSWIIKHIDNYNSSLYYENPSYILACYNDGTILSD